MEIQLTGIAAEKYNQSSLNYEGETRVSSLLAYILKEQPALSEFVLKVSVNRELAQANDSFEPEDHIMVFNPFSGG